jgi:hypothetical protein
MVNTLFTPQIYRITTTTLSEVGMSKYLSPDLRLKSLRTEVWYIDADICAD